MLPEGTVIDGKYRVVRPLGEGGMGTVYEGLNLRLKRRVAIKVMHAAMARDKKLVTRFEREAQAAANIGSRHVVDVFDLGDLPSGDRYMVMELLEGESLQSRLVARGRLSPIEIARIGVQLLDGLARVHHAGIIHRDLKPANIFIAREPEGEEVVKILDFGICKITDGRARGEPSLGTGIGDVIGTLAYMSPEQLEHGSKGLDARADIYAVGVMLYRAVSGQLPFGSQSVVELLRELRTGHVPRVADLASDVDKRFGAIVHRALEWDRDARWSSAKELGRALEDWLASIERISDALASFLVEAPPPSAKASAPAPSSGTPIARIRAPRDTVRMDEPDDDK